MWALIWKNQHNDKTVNVVTHIFGPFVGLVRLERCYINSISMEVSEIVIYIMKIILNFFSGAPRAREARAWAEPHC